MKKLIFLMAMIATMFAVQIEAQAQRFGTLKNQDNTYRALNIGLINYTLVTGVDTIKAIPNAFETHVKVSTTLSDSCAFQIKATTYSKLGDKIYICARSDASTRKFKLVSNTNLITGSTTSISLVANKSLVLVLYYDGTRWIEQDRFVQP
jgi:uncharacterized transporter YbjL